MEPSGVKLFPECKKAHAKNKKYRNKYPPLKVIAYNINEILSLDMTYVDKLAKQNIGSKFLLFRVGCLSHFLRV